MERPKFQGIRLPRGVTSEAVAEYAKTCFGLTPAQIVDGWMQQQKAVIWSAKGNRRGGLSPRDVSITPRLRPSDFFDSR